MAQHERRIPARPSPRAPPPPRSFAPPPPPSYSKHVEKHKKKRRIPKTREQLNRSQIKTVIVVIILFVLYFITIYLALTIRTDSDSTIMESDQDQYAWWFRIPDLMSNKIPTEIEVTASSEVEFLIIREEDYDETKSASELRSAAMNAGLAELTEFSYVNEMDPGEYYIVSIADENDQNIELEYKITRYFLLPFLWLISILFILPIIFGLVWLLVLQRRKSRAPVDTSGPQGYAPPYGHENGYHSGRSNYHGPKEHYDYPGDHEEHYRDDYDYNRYEHHPPPHRRQTKSHNYHYRQGKNNEYDPHYPPPSTPPLHPHENGHYDRRASQNRIYESEQLETQYRDREGDYASSMPPPPTHSDAQRLQKPPTSRPASKPKKSRAENIESSEISTVPCKCGEVIVITDPTRPLRIKCPRCGRRGILEGKERSEEDDVFY